MKMKLANALFLSVIAAWSINACAEVPDRRFI